MATTTKRRLPARARWLIPGLCLAAALAACGGGGGGGGSTDASSGGGRDAPSVVAAAPQAADHQAADLQDPASPAPAPVSASLPTSAPAAVPASASAGAPVVAPALAAAVDAGLDPQPPELLDSTRSGERRIKAVGGLDDGGHVVVWMSHEPGDPGTAWPLWLQRFDAQGRKQGPVVRMDYPQEALGPDAVAVSVLPEGRIGLTFVTSRLENIAFGVTEVNFWPFNLEGAVNGTVRVLESLPFSHGAPRSTRLAGPVMTAVGPDGSQFVSWRVQIVGAPPLIPTVHAQRLAADGDPLTWIQRLDGEGGLSRVGAVDLSALDEGGWIVSEERINSVGVHTTSFTQLEVARSLALPQSFNHSASAFFLDLRGHGSVLFTAEVDPVTGAQGPALRLHFDTRGLLQPARALDRIPPSAVALSGGDYLTLDLQGGQLAAQRYTPTGDAVGPAFLTEATPGALGAGLRRGALALAWVTTTAEGEVRVWSQRWQPRAPS